MDTTTNFKFGETKKMINSPDKLDIFLKGNIFNLIMDFIVSLQKSIVGISKLDNVLTNDKPFLTNFNNVIQKLNDLIKEVPALEQPQRFGNKAFKTWADKVEEAYPDLINSIIDKNKHLGLDVELKNYFLESFGSSKRLDYGTGHELNFLCVLLIFFLLGYYTEKEFSQVVHHIFFPYILLVRNLQVTYKLEPAGAHGVWGLDEYHFLPFLFGSAELIGNLDILPGDVKNDRVLDENENKFMYLSCVKYVKQVKKGATFAEHSPMLDTISNVPNWDKISKGLIKMYVDEVLKKFVVMQHFYFGNVLKFE